MREATFNALFGEQPYGFQLRVADALLDGRNVILQAPTGAGKTKAALFPYLTARGERLPFPSKLLYAVPMRVLAQAFHTALIRTPGGTGLDARVQTGEQQDDRRFEADATFATIDQVLSSFLCIPYSLSFRQGNLNAGAAVGSYLVFDEFHLLDPGSSLATTLEMLRRLRGVAPFLLMTATFSAVMLHRLASWLEAAVVTMPPDELKMIPSQRNKTRRLHRERRVLDADAVLTNHRHRSIAICNTVDRAQALYDELRAQLDRHGDQQTKLLLLHSRFLRSHRREKAGEIERLFGKEARPFEGSAILVATQVIEVGLDITCQVLHTEVAPANSILQRAGRCARFEDEVGDVFVYRVPTDEQGRLDTAPYLNQQAELVAKTWEALSDLPAGHVDFSAEQRLVDAVHTAADQRMLDALAQAHHQRWTEVNRAIDDQEFGLARELIRADDSVTLIVHPDPGEETDPFAFEGFSLHPGSLQKQFLSWQQRGFAERLAWLLRCPEEAPREGQAEDERRRRYRWSVVESDRQLSRSAVLAIHPELVEYDPDRGFRFGTGNGFVSPPAPRKNEVVRHGYRRESYAEHIANVLRAFELAPRQELAFPSRRLEERLGLSTGAIEQATRLAIVLHDAGKLARRWQGWAATWQKHVGQPVEPLPLAHTDYDPANSSHQRLERELDHLRPPHAVEGAIACGVLVARLLKVQRRDGPQAKLLRAVLSAVARHHTPVALKLQEPFELLPTAPRVLADALRQIGIERAPIETVKLNATVATDLHALAVRADDGDTDLLLLYWLIVRALRLADQCSFSVTDREER